MGIFVVLTRLSVFLEKARITKVFRVGIGALLFAKGGHNIDKALDVLHLSLGEACIFLLLFGRFGSLTSLFPRWAKDPFQE